MTTEDICRVCDYRESWFQKHGKFALFGLICSLPFWLGVARMWGWL